MSRVTKGPLIELPEDTAPSGVAMYRRLAERLQQMIVAGTLPSGSQLPSTRQMAADLKCSRNTVSTAIDYLEAEGYVTSRRGAGTYVADVLPEEFAHPAAAETETVSAQGRQEPRLAEFSAKMQTARPQREQKLTTFSRQPDVAHFPFDQWALLFREIWEQPDVSLVREEDPMGYMPLRAAIAEHLSFWRGITCMPEQIMITSGTTQALHFLAKMLLNKGDACWVEEPGFLEAKSAIQSVEGQIVPVGVDKAGLNVSLALKAAPDAKAAFVTPSHQHPLGHVMSIERRRELLKWAYEKGAWVIEDDHDAEIRHKGSMQPALKAMDSADHVIYVGTFSKILFQSLRIGFMVLPHRLLEPAKSVRSFVEVCPPVMMQPVLARFIGEGHFVRYLRRMRVMYEQKMWTFLEKSKAYLGDYLHIEEDLIGTHVVGYVRPEYTGKCDDKALSRKLLAEGVNATPLSDYYYNPKPKNGFVFGYGSASEVDMDEGLQIILKVLRATF